MRLRRLELAVIALTLAFVCFMGGYFTGRKGAVNIVTVSSQQTQPHKAEAAALPDKVISNQPIADGTESSDANTGAAGNNVTDDSNGNADDKPTAGNGTVSGGETALQTPETAGTPTGGDGKININLASQSELMDLPGIGSVLASRIVDYRRQHGGFSKIEDLRNVSGIGAKRYESIKDQITVG